MKNLLNNTKFALNESRIKPAVAIVAIVILLAYPFIFNTPFMRNLGIITLMWMCLGSAWNIFGGYTGQVSLGHAMFFGVGAYGVAIPFFYWRITPWIGVLVGIVVAVLLALVVAIPIFRLSAQYFAIATIALGETVRIIAINLPITRGMRGLDWLDFTMNPLISLQFRSRLPFYFAFLVLFILVVCTMLYINCTKAGYYFRTIKANQTAAESVGIDTRKYKTYALVTSAIICSICGSIYAQYLLYIDPSTVFIGEISTRMVLMVVIGGIATIQGPIIGALILVPLSELTRIQFGADIPGLDLVLYAVTIILVILYKPQGVVSLGDSIRKMLQKHRRRKDAEAKV